MDHPRSRRAPGPARTRPSRRPRARAARPLGPLRRTTKKSAHGRRFRRARRGVPIGTAGFFRVGWVRRFPALNEFFVHHEDVRRANGGGPRTHEPAMDEALWRNVGFAPWFLARRLRGAGLELQWAGTDKITRVRRGEPVARVAGSPGELLLYLFGRRDAADVEVSGPATAIEAVRRARFGM